MASAAIKIGDTIQLQSGGFAMTVESLVDERAVCVRADKVGRRRRDTSVLVPPRRHDPFADVGMLIIEGVTHSTAEMRAMGLKH